MVKESITLRATWAQELTNERLMSMAFNLTSKSNAITFGVRLHMARQILSQIRGDQKDVFWGDLDGALSRVLSSDHLFILIYMLMI